MSVLINGTDGIDFNDGSNQSTSATPYGRKNLIINGDMRIDQRNAGSSVTITTDSTYTLDRWMCEVSQASKFSVQQDAAAVTPPAGFNDYLGVTSLSSYSVVASDYFTVMQRIEGYNVANLDFGKATAKTVTLSFWVRSSLTGTFGGSIGNSAENRSYPFSYTISAANTWEQKTITIAGDTTGTWLITNGRGLNVRFSLGMGSTFTDTANAWTTKANVYSATGATSVVGTSGATFYITGCQLEIGDAASDFEFMPYDMELARCQRYCEVYDNPNLNSEQDLFPQMMGQMDISGRPETHVIYQEKRANPSITFSSTTALSWQAMDNTNAAMTYVGAYIGTGRRSALLFGSCGGKIAGTLSGHGTFSWTGVANKLIIDAEL